MSPTPVPAPARWPDVIDVWLSPWWAAQPAFDVWARSVDGLLEASLATQHGLLGVWLGVARQSDRVAQEVAAQLRYSALDLLDQLDQERAARARAEQERQRQAERAERDSADRRRAEQERDQARARADQAEAARQRLERELAREREVAHNNHAPAPTSSRRGPANATTAVRRPRKPRAKKA